MKVIKKLIQLLLGILLLGSQVDLDAAKKRGRIEVQGEHEAPLLPVSGGAGGAVEDKATAAEKIDPVSEKVANGDKQDVLASPFVCECGARFTFKSGLRRHQQKRCKLNPDRDKKNAPTIVRDYTTRFRRAQNPVNTDLVGALQEAEIIPEKCYECYCGKSYLRAYELKQHQETAHEGKLLFSCLVTGCKEKFRSRYWLIKHLKEHKLLRVREKSERAKKKKSDACQVAQVQPLTLASTVVAGDNEAIAEKSFWDDLDIDAIGTSEDYIFSEEDLLAFIKGQEDATTLVIPACEYVSDRVLASMENLVALESLTMTGCSGFTQEGIKRFVERSVSLKFLYLSLPQDDAVALEAIKPGLMVMTFDIPVG